MSNKFTEKTYEKPKKFTYIVKTGDPKTLLNVRSTPEVKPSNVIGFLHSGDKVEATTKLDRSNEFTEIMFYNGDLSGTAFAFVMTSKLE